MQGFETEDVELLYDLVGEDDFERLYLYFGGVPADLAVDEVDAIFELIVVVGGHHLLFPFFEEVFVFRVVPAILVEVDVQLFD